MHPSTAPANIRPAVSAAALTGAAQPNAGYVLIVQDERGLVYIGHDENAVMKLERMRAGGLVINDRRVIRSEWTPHAREIALSLTQQFRAHQGQFHAAVPWFAIPWADAVTAFEDWDTDRGQIRRTGDYLIGDQVQITADPRAVGQITAFRQEGPTRKARVHFHKPGAQIGGVRYLDAWCPMGELKALGVNSSVIRWLVHGEVGMSSKQMAFWLEFDEITDRRHPHDPDDLDRCLKLLAACPHLRDNLPGMAKVSPYWAALIARWDEVEAMHLDEVGLGWTKANHAPKTYQLMKSIYAEVEARA